MSSELMVMTFPRQHKADTVLAAIRAMRKSPILCLDSVVVATQDHTGELTLRPGQEPATAQEDRDTQILLALADSILCTPAQEAIAAVTDRGMDRRFMSEIARGMEGESSALFVLAREDSVHDAGETRSALALFRGRIHQTSLPPEAEAYLSERWASSFPRKGDEMTNISSQEAKQIAEEAYIFAFSMLENYKTMYAFSASKDLPSFRAPFNQFFHMRQLLGPEFTEVVGPNNDTLYSTAWLDLGTEPIVLSLPDIPDNRYFVIQIVDMYTFNVEYIGARTTGYQAGKYLFTGPGWDNPTPEGIDGVRRTEGRFIFLLGRTAVSGVADVPAVKALQDQYTLTPLSAYLGQVAPEPAPAPAFPPYDPEKAASIEFISYLNFLLGQLEPGPDEQSLLKKWAQIGVQPGRPFDPEALAPDIRQAVAEGVAAAHEKIKAESLRVGRNVNNWTLIGEGFGYRSMVGGKDLLRAAANMVGIYGNNPEEAYNFSGALDGDGEPLDASKHNYVIHFETPPPVKAFWSVTMYKLPTPLFIANPIKRYSIGDRTPGFEPNEDGSVTIYLQHESPGPEREANWLPAPDGPFALALRIYWPAQDILDGKWEPSAIKKA